MQQVYTARDSMDANFLRGLLEQEGIKAVVQGEALEETWGDLNLSQKALPSVWVDDADLGRAAPIVEEYRQRDAADANIPDEAREAAAAARPKWVCHNCGKLSEEQFTACWHCGHERKMGPEGGTAVV
jgi:hypothetical protein